jgi:uncharacterized protein (DUF169 family)
MGLAAESVALLDRLGFEVPPVGVKFSARAPHGIRKLDERLAFCEMLRKAQQGGAFFAGAEDHACEAGLYVLGQAESPEPFVSGEFGARLRIFEEPRSAGRLYLHIPRIGKGVVRYVSFSPLHEVSFDPDLLILLADADQTEILLRAMSYRTGQVWESRFTAAIGCAWTYAYPYLSGKLNYVVTGLGHGMRRRKLFPEGRQVISIPFDLLPSILQNLKDMPWVLPAYEPEGTAFVQQVLTDLGMGPPGGK